MPFDAFDRRRLRFRPLARRRNRVRIERDAVRPDDEPGRLSGEVIEVVGRTAERIRAARRSGRPVVMAFGAHAIKNGLGPVLIRLMERGWLTHLATNGAGIIHDWELAYLGESSEHVAENVARGTFGAWEETGYYLSLALLVGAWRGLGYGESVGAMIEQQGLELPAREELLARAREALSARPVSQGAGAAADLLWAMDSFLGIPFTGHPMVGQDIIYLHPLCHGAAVGRCGLRDFLVFAGAVCRLSGGVYLSVGSAVMSPMIFEKAMAMAQNLAVQRGQRIEGHYMCVVDLQRSSWDWSRGEPPQSHPDYYLRFYKTFNRMGGEVAYASCDNRDFLLALRHELDGGGP